jgi:plasmid stabilization system protein ParE
MAVKLLEIHPSALAEFESSVSWYLERNRAAAEKFTAAVDQAIELVSTPFRWPQGDYGTWRII